jgi:RNA polymerase sigma factor (sigma-70 family)
LGGLDVRGIRAFNQRDTAQETTTISDNAIHDVRRFFAMTFEEPSSFDQQFRTRRVPRDARPSFASQIERLPPSAKPVVVSLFEREDWAGEYILANRPQLIRIFWSRTGNAQDAEGMISDLYIRASKHRKPDHPERWLVSVAQNLAIDHFRVKSREAARFLPLPDDELLAADFDDPSEAEELREALVAAIGRLQAHHQEVIVSRFLEDRSVEEIAKQEGIGTTTTYERLRRALAEMKDVISREFPW